MKDWPITPYTPPQSWDLVGAGAGAAYSYGRHIFDRFKQVYRAVSTGRAKRSLTRTLTEEEKQPGMDQGTGLRRRTIGRRVKKVNRFSFKRLESADTRLQVQCLGTKNGSGGYLLRHPVFEFDPGRGGYLAICKQSAASTDSPLQGYTPMHIFDLNMFETADVRDSPTTYTGVSLSHCDNINARAWVWTNTNKWSQYVRRATESGPVELYTDSLRYYTQDHRGNAMIDSYRANKVYRKGIDCKFVAYGCTKMPTEFEFRIIRITDPNMCPDNPNSLGTEDLRTFQQNWQNMVRSWTINPILHGVEPQPRAVKPWFETVCKRRFRVGEKTTEIDSMPCVEGSMYVALNQLVRYAWNDRSFVVETGNAAYDGAPDVEATDVNTNVTFNEHGRPYYTSRYYLLVRALSPVDCVPLTNDGDQDTIIEEDKSADWKYMPSYDLVLRTLWLNKTGGKT